MRINYFSDIHLEFGELDLPSNNADIIIAAGDIGVNKQGLDWLSKLNKPVIYIAGNHEFYEYDFQQTLDELKKADGSKRLYFLENESCILQGVRFLGCTLWSDLFFDGESKAVLLAQRLNDFRKIRLHGGHLDADAYSMMYHRSRTWLEQELAKPFAGKTVVITHHAPTFSSWQDSPGALKKLAYCNDLDVLLYKYRVSAWFHGHVHTVADYQVAGVRVLCNPRGYYGEKLVDGFDLNKTVEI